MWAGNSGARIRGGGSNSHFWPERGCVVSTSRSSSRIATASVFAHALRLVCDTAAFRKRSIAGEAAKPLVRTFGTDMVGWFNKCEPVPA
jgi:hypothetical protein